MEKSQNIKKELPDFTRQSISIIGMGPVGLSLALLLSEEYQN